MSLSLRVHDCELILFNIFSDVAVVVSMFYSLAVFHNKFESYGSEPRILLATSINPRMGGGQQPANCVVFQLHIPVV